MPRTSRRSPTASGPAGDALRHPRPHRHHDRRRDLPRASPPTTGSSRSRTPSATCTAACGSCTRPGCVLLRRRRAQPRLARPTAAAASSPSSATSPASEYAAMVAAVDRRRPRRARSRSTASCVPVVEAIMTTAPGRDDREGGAAAARRAAHTAPSRLPLVPADEDSSTTCATGSAAPGSSPKALHEPSAPRARPPPARCRKSGLRVIPLGGLGEVGRNMTVFEYDGRLLIVDCGVLFPEDHHPGVDLILPDFDPIRDRLDQVEALVLTHGHEDHIGATPYLLRERGDIPLVGSQLTLALLDLQAARAPAQGDRAARRHGGRHDRVRAVRPRVRRGQPLDPRRARGRDPHRRRHRAAHRRLQDGPAAARRPDHRPAGVRPARRGGRRPVHGRLHQRRGARASPPPRWRSARCSTGSSTPAATSGSSWPASPPTSTACSR